jgi:hypothetical protein
VKLKFTRSQKAMIAGVSAALWLGYMSVGLALINSIIPTVEGVGPEGTVAFIGLISGFFVCCLAMWAASD